LNEDVDQEPTCEVARAEHSASQSALPGPKPSGPQSRADPPASPGWDARTGAGRCAVTGSEQHSTAERARGRSANHAAGDPIEPHDAAAPSVTVGSLWW